MQYGLVIVVAMFPKLRNYTNKLIVIPKYVRSFLKK